MLLPHEVLLWRTLRYWSTRFCVLRGYVFPYLPVESYCTTNTVGCHSVHRTQDRRILNSSTGSTPYSGVLRIADPMSGGYCTGTWVLIQQTASHNSVGDQPSCFVHHFLALQSSLLSSFIIILHDWLSSFPCLMGRSSSSECTENGVCSCLAVRTATDSIVLD